jgi:hypothetical protein
VNSSCSRKLAASSSSCPCYKSKQRSNERKKTVFSPPNAWEANASATTHSDNNHHMTPELKWLKCEDNSLQHTSTCVSSILRFWCRVIFKLVAWINIKY